MTLGRSVAGAVSLGVVLAAGVAGLLLLRGGDEGGTVQAVTGRKALDATGRAALALVNVDAASLGYQVSFEPGRAGVRASTDRASKRISVFLRDGDSPTIVAHDIAHELGHAYDDARMSDADRSDYLRRRGVPSSPWLPAGDDDYGVGAGDFAEVYALCHSASPDFRGRLAPRPQDACELLPAGAQ